MRWCGATINVRHLQQLDQQTFDLLLLDVGLPDGSGYDICTYAKSRQDVPVLFLTALDDEGNVVMGLDMGGDDYITKPFRINELLSRMRSVQRRYHRQEEDIVQIQYLSIYPKQGKVYREQEEVLLTALEYRLLMVFINHPQQVLSCWRESGMLPVILSMTIHLPCILNVFVKSWSAIRRIRRSL